MVEDPDLDDGGGLLAWSAERINDGWGIGKFLKSGIGLTIAGVFALTFNILDAIVAFIETPLRGAGSAVGALFSGLLTSPVSILSSTAQTSGTEISATFTGFLGPLAFPVGVASVMGGLYIVSIYLEERETSDIFPGSFTDVDVPEFVPIIGDPGVPEEGEEEEERD